MDIPSRTWPILSRQRELRSFLSSLRSFKDRPRRRHTRSFDSVYTFVYYKESGVMAELSFEWDEEKNAANIKNHGIDFLDAALIFENPTIEAIDERADYGELRYIALGLSGETVLYVVYTWRGENIIRIISARRANRHDAEKYYRETFTYRNQEKNPSRRKQNARRRRGSRASGRRFLEYRPGRHAAGEDFRSSSR
jgi:uncharacterized DUF497 family protein